MVVRVKITTHFLSESGKLFVSFSSAQKKYQAVRLSNVNTTNSERGVDMKYPIAMLKKVETATKIGGNIQLRSKE